jgi:hypothetical protein
MSLRAVSVKINDISSARIRNISYDSNINVKVDTQQDYKVKSVGFGARRLKNLEDVSALSPQDEDVLIYNAVSEKYESKKISSDQIDLDNIDAGTF